MQRPMSRPFLKMNGLGNDFVVVETGREPFDPAPDQVRAWAARDGSGVGFDQLIGVSSDGGPEPLVRFWNSGGEEVSACGNGSRCVGWLLMKASGKDEARFRTAERALSAVRAGDAVSVDMGEPRLDWTQIPLAEEMDTRNIELQIGPIDNPRLHTPGAVSMGNPHVVFFVSDIDEVDVARDGSLIENHPLFPQGVNVGFAQVKSRDRIRLRVWERGAGLTKACGTGACAALVACHRRGLTGREATLELDGGELVIEWREADNHVIMTGAVEVEYSGVLP